MCPAGRRTRHTFSRISCVCVCDLSLSLCFAVCEECGMDLFPLVAFALSSSSLLVLNKSCIARFGLPSLNAALQFALSSLWVIILHITGREVIELEWRRVWSYLAYVAIFSTAIYCNMRALAHVSVETIIVCRSCCPMLVCVLEAGLLGRQLPSARSACTLLALFAAATGYASAEFASRSGSSLDAITNGRVLAAGWVTLYYIFICASDTHGKLMLNRLSWRSMWGPVLYTNALSLPPMLALAALTGEFEQLRASQWRPAAWGGEQMASLLMVVLACVSGISISYYGWRSRQICTATQFTVLGVANKLLAVLGSAVLSDHPLSPLGALCLVGCLVLAASYRPAPLRADAVQSERVTSQRLVAQLKPLKQN